MLGTSMASDTIALNSIAQFGQEYHPNEMFGAFPIKWGFVERSGTEQSSIDIRLGDYRWCVFDSGDGGWTARVDRNIVKDLLICYLHRLAHSRRQLSPYTSTSSLLPVNDPISYVPTVPTVREPQELLDALEDLRGAISEAAEEGFPIPSATAVGNAEGMLREIYQICHRRYEVYPTPDGEIAIDAPTGQGRSVIMLCDSEGGALLLVNKNGVSESRRYTSINMLPDDFLRGVLRELHP